MTDTLEAKLARLSAYANPFAASEPLAPSVSRAADFIDYEHHHMFPLFEARGLKPSADEIINALKLDDAPIPASQNREGYGANDFHYWVSGYAEYLGLSKIALRHGISHGSILDFGGSTGRVFRHFHYQGGWKVWSNDFKQTSVEWNLLNFPPALRLFQGLYQPTLPINDKTFDLIIAMSVFTHIDETETNWLLELRRTLKIGGLALVTTHNEATWQDMGAELRSALEAHSPELAALSELPAGRHVSNFRNDDPYRCNVFHSDDYVRRQWSRYFQVVEIIPRASDAQAILVLKRTD
ncbi:class I SAM-dependent methyltransferase [uncultured Sphingomonas sp.]|uniref:class I SAM-dependent methyltransferase n=1 Tax=uncultured Sphingomonas sp. TaxID=158754 RepID=UPI0035CABA2E